MQKKGSLIKRKKEIFLAGLSIFIFSIAFSQIDSPEQVNQLIERLKDNNRQSRQQAVLSLADIGKPAVPALLKALENERLNEQGRKRTRVIQGITNVLGKIGDKSTIPGLLNLVQDNNENVVIYATESLCMIKDEASLNNLMKFAVQENHIVGNIIALNRGMITDEVATQMSTHLTAGISICTGMVNKGEHIIPILIKALDDKDWQVRYFAIGILNQIAMRYPSYKQTIMRSFKDRLIDIHPTIVEVVKGYLEKPK